MGGNAKTTEFLKECLSDALIKLLKTKPIEKITIPEIAEMANVGRTTYFRNFTAKNEVLTFKITQLWDRWADEHGLAEPRGYSPNNALDFFNFNSSIRELLNLIYTRGLQSALYDAFYHIIMPPYGATSIERYKNSFYCYGLFGLLDQWIKCKYKESPEEMAKIFLKEIVGQKDRI
ncbi:TetR/AcrR family transcriptional regulator [Hominifimenecus sp. rT4P-3]|uniref:TetR/AcrR family transcriptional regulator n=1 Tax=Hominifimenecus sp. rT4P-3 TaxID=3242979 RepID=UPI003DA61955